MNPYGRLRVDREPFSNTPDPAFLSSTRQHATCLRELEIALRLRRGLCVVSGDIGTGKTTLCRSLVRELAASSETDLHLLLDPEFESSAEFLRVLLASFTRVRSAPLVTPEPDLSAVVAPSAAVSPVVEADTALAAPGWAEGDFVEAPLAPVECATTEGVAQAEEAGPVLAARQGESAQGESSQGDTAPGLAVGQAAGCSTGRGSAAAQEGPSTWQLKEAIKLTLFRLAEEEKRLVVLVIDEGQKLARENLEILRELLNYETNDCKLLQIVIFGQCELEPVLAAMPNLVDRITLHRKLVPLSLRETAAMIRHRLAVATVEGQPPHDLFRPLAIVVLFVLSGGSPRKIVRLCHNAMLETVLRGKSHVGLIEALAARQPGDSLLRRSRTARAALGFVVTCALVFLLWLSLGGSGPVLHSPQAGGSLALAGGSEALGGADGASAHRDAPPTLRAEGAPPRPVPAGTTLMPETTSDPAGGLPFGLSLAPETDGPTLRGTVTPSAPSVSPGAVSASAVSPGAPTAAPATPRSASPVAKAEPVVKAGPAAQGPVRSTARQATAHKPGAGVPPHA